MMKKIASDDNGDALYVNIIIIIFIMLYCL